MSIGNARAEDISFYSEAGKFPINATQYEEMGMNLVKTSMMILFAAIFMVAPGVAGAASGKCTVVEVKGEKVVLECSQQAGKLQKGDNIKIKSARAGGAVEGC